MILLLMEQNLLTTGKALYILSTLKGVFISWMALISSISCMTWESVEQIAASQQLDLTSLMAKNMNSKLNPVQRKVSCKKEKSVCVSRARTLNY